MVARHRIAAALSLLAIPVLAHAQVNAQANAQERPPAPPAFLSPEVNVDRHITFRLYAPDAAAVAMQATDIPELVRGRHELVKALNGVWEITVGPVPAGSYRYRFLVGALPAPVATMDPRNPVVSESQGNAWSLVDVPGADAFDTRDVPHGSVSSVPYYSKVLGHWRRLHVYTPPGYELGGSRKYPVLYLLHGAGDNDHSWSSVGRAGFILDNLIAAGRAKPMLVVMPAGHTAAPGAPTRGLDLDDFTKEFTTDILPFTETHYRALNDRKSRAIAGLSMGGAQTLNIAFGRLDGFSAIGVFSSGILGQAPAGAATSPIEAWEHAHAAALDNAALKKGLALFWFATGSEDFLVKTTEGTVDLFKKHGFNAVYKPSGGGHTWLNWRDYLAEFAPQLFR